MFWPSFQLYKTNVHVFSIISIIPVPPICLKLKGKKYNHADNKTSGTEIAELGQKEVLCVFFATQSRLPLLKNFPVTFLVSYVLGKIFWRYFTMNYDNYEEKKKKKKGKQHAQKKHLNV